MSGSRRENTETLSRDSGKEALGRIPGWVTGFVDTPAGRVPRLSTELSPADRRGCVRCRFSDGFRMKYSVTPGLYAAGNPGPGSPVLVTANYKLSLDSLRRELGGVDAWVLVLDTRGINVWCAAGKGSFGTSELVKRVRAAGLSELVRHRTLILPQLGAAGVRAHRVKEESGFGVLYGPVRACDLPEYLRAGRKATAGMRTVRFGFLDRMELTPMELVPALKKSPVFLLGLFVFFGLRPRGIFFKEALSGGLPFAVLGLLMVLAGCFFAPLLLPALPSRSFAVKGWLLGAAITGGFAALRCDAILSNVFLLPLTALLFPAVSSYLALNFTGSTPFTGVSGVKRELGAAIPLTIAAVALASVFAVLFILRTWEIL
jgi:hypothetical protein